VFRLGAPARRRSSPTGSTEDPGRSGLTTLRTAAPVNEGTATRRPASTTTDPLARGCTCGATVGRRRVSRNCRPGHYARIPSAARNGKAAITFCGNKLRTGAGFCAEDTRGGAGPGAGAGSVARRGTRNRSARSCAQWIVRRKIMISSKHRVQSPYFRSATRNFILCDRHLLGGLRV